MIRQKMEETKKYAIELIQIACPLVAAAKETKDYMNNIANIILFDKINKFIEIQDDDFDEWLKIACDFQKDSIEYEKTVKMLIYTIESINDENKIDVYANLMRSYRAKLLSKKFFLRLSSLLPIVFYDDLVFLKNNINKESIEDIKNEVFLSPEISSLLNHGLFYCTNSATHEYTGGIRRYKNSKLGLEMVRCGVNYDNHCEYNEFSVAKHIQDTLIIDGGSF